MVETFTFVVMPAPLVWRLAAFLDVFQEQGKMDVDGAIKYPGGLVKEGRLAEDLDS